MSSCFSERRIVAGATLGQAPRGRLACPLPQEFPPKYANENLDYVVDFSVKAQLEGSDAGSLSGFSVSVLPAESSAIEISQKSIDGLNAVFFAGGGVAGMEYVVTVMGALPGMKVMQATAKLRILPNLAPRNRSFAPGVPVEIDDVAGDVITDSASNPITSS